MVDFQARNCQASARKATRLGESQIPLADAICRA